MKQKKRMLVVCPYPEHVAPSQRLKFEQYYDAFRSAGYEVTVSPFISPAFWQIIYKPGFLLKKIGYTLAGYCKRITDLFCLHRYDVVYTHLWVTPFGPPFFEWLFSRLAKKMVYDIDDLVYLGDEKSKAHPVVNWIKGRQKPIFLMKAAGHVITCTPYLDNFVRQYNINTTDISSTVDTINRYKPVNSYSQAGKVTLGWSGSLSTAKYFYLLAPVLKRLKQQHEFSILVIGDPNVQIEELDIEALSWQEQSEVERLQQIDIGLYPLPDEQWVYGKSGLKAIQYMALGIPTVATAIGANYRVIEHGVSGFLVKTEDEWVAALSRLINDAALRQQIGIAGRRRIEACFSVHENTGRYLSVIESL